MKKYQNIFMLSAMLLSAQVAHSQRAIAFEGIENARDMGGAGDAGRTNGSCGYAGA